jgi:hypothetical protein
MRNTFRAIVSTIALALLVLPAVAVAQGPSEQEAVQIQLRLMQTQQQAMQDPGVQTAYEELTEHLLTAMERVDPSVGDKAARAETLQAEAIAAQQADDDQRLQQLAAEAEQLQTEFAVLQQQAMQDPELQASMVNFQDRVVAKMTEIDPETPQLLARLEELHGGG